MKVNSIIDSVRNLLREEFHVPAVTERDEQNPKPPYFFIRDYRNANDQMINGRFSHMIDMEVRYHPAETRPCDSQKARKEMNDISDRLMYLLRIIDVGGIKLLAQDIESVESDGVLVTTFGVQITERFIRQAEMMETQTTEVKVMLTEHTHIKDKSDGG